jgi:hypothetical protein
MKANFSVERIAAGGIWMRIRPPVARPHRSPRRSSMCEWSEPRPRALKGRDISARGKRGTSAAPGTAPLNFTSLSSSGGEGWGEEAVRVGSSPIKANQSLHSKPR